MTDQFYLVRAQYNKATNNQMKRRVRQGRDFFTKAEQAALKFYSEAFNKLETIFKESNDAANTDLRGSELEQLPVDSGHAEPGTPA